MSALPHRTQSSLPVQSALRELAARAVLPCEQVDRTLSGEGRHSLTYDELCEVVKVRLAQDECVILSGAHLSNLAQVNDVFGYETGDQLLKLVGLVLETVLATHDPGASFARIPGARFVIAHGDGSRHDEVLSMMRAALTELRLQHGAAVVIPRTIVTKHDLGVGIPMTAKHIQGLVDERLGRARTSESAEPASTVRALHANDVDPLRVVECLRNGEVEVHYQPVCHTDTGAIYDVEALARVRLDGELVVAGRFIDDLDALGEIQLLDTVVLERVVQDAAALSRVTSRLFVNVSPLSLGDPDFGQHMRDCIARLESAGLSIVLVLELTEQSVIRNVNVVRELSETLGVSFAIDDFGTGYSSLGLVSELAAHKAITYLKLDGSLVRTVASSPAAYKVVLAIVNLAKSLELELIAEYVADEACLDALRSAGVKLGQGYFFAPALALDVLLERFADGKSAPPARAFRAERLQVLEPYLPKALNTFYEVLLTDPHFTAFFGGREQIVRLIERQHASFLASLIDSDEALRVRYERLGQIHRSIGIPASSFLKGTDILHDEFIEVLAAVTNDGALIGDTMRFFHRLRDHMAWGFLQEDLRAHLGTLADRQSDLAAFGYSEHEAQALCGCPRRVLAAALEGDPSVLSDDEAACPASAQIEQLVARSDATGQARSDEVAVQLRGYHREIHSLGASVGYFVERAEHASLLSLLDRVFALGVSMASSALGLAAGQRERESAAQPPRLVVRR